MNRLFVSAMHKSSGKTTVTTGLAAALAKRGVAVQTFKKGPDYIDPLWLSQAAGRPCRNLDFHCMGEDEIVAAFAAYAANADLSLIEGNKGLYDGVDVEGGDSNAALAVLLGAPVVLVADTRGMTRGIAPLIQGYRSFGPDITIAGLILNQVGGPRHESKLRAAIERYTDVPVLGVLGRHPEMEIAERHLGLVPANETTEARALIDAMADVVEAGIDIERLGALACVAGPEWPDAAGPPATTGATDVSIAVARDAAFGFYYPDDLEALTRAGAELRFFDSLSDSRLPEADGLFIGGGFPETQAAALAANTALRADIRSALEDGMPAYAECGGLIYLARDLTWRGQTHEMVGFVPANAVMHERPVGRGYVVLAETGTGPWPGGDADIPVHEFHYASLDNLPPDAAFAYEVKRGHGIDGKRDGLVTGNLVATFAHQRDVAANRWAGRFVGFVRSKRAS